MDVVDVPLRGAILRPHPQRVGEEHAKLLLARRQAGGFFRPAEGQDRPMRVQERRGAAGQRQCRMPARDDLIVE